MTDTPDGSPVAIVAPLAGPSATAVANPADPPDRELAAEDVWQDSASRLLARLRSTEAGLTTAEAQARLAIYGPNDAATVHRSPLWLQFLARFRNPLVI